MRLLSRMLPVTHASQAARRVAGSRRKAEPDNPLLDDDVCQRCPKPSQGGGLRAQGALAVSGPRRWWAERGGRTLQARWLCLCASRAHVEPRVLGGVLGAVRGDLGGSSVAPRARRALFLSSLDLHYAWTFVWYAWFAAVLRHAASVRKNETKSRSSRGGFPAWIRGCFAYVSRLFCAVLRLFRGCRTGCFASFAAVSRLFHGCFAGVRGLTTCVWL